MLPSAQAFIEALDRAKIKYKGNRDLDNGKSLVVCGFELKNCRLDVLFFFDENNESATISIPKLVAGCPEDRTLRMLDAINELNARFRWLKLYMDKDQNVNAQIDTILNDDPERNICLVHLMFLLKFVDEYYPTLMHVIWG